MFDKIEKAYATESGFDDPEMEMYSVGYSDGLNDGEEWGWSLVDRMTEIMNNPDKEFAVELALKQIHLWNHMR